MAISGPDHVDNGMQSGGKMLAQLPSGTARTISLSQPDIIQLQGNRTQVAAYQQQGDDLILQMQDGSVVRYQHFFKSVDGEQSELVFVDGDNPPDRVLFSEALQADPQSLTALTPTFTSLNAAEAGQLTESTAGSDATTAVGLALGLLGVGAGVAAAASGGSGGGSSDDGAAKNAPVVNDSAVPDRAATPPAGDGASVAVPGSGTGETGESTPPVTVPGSGTDETGGSAPAVTVPGSGTDETGESTPPATLPGSGTGECTPPVTVPDSSEDGSTPPTVTPGAPALTVNPFAGDNVVSVEEKSSLQSVSGTSSNLATGSTLAVSLNGKTYTTTVSDDGSWHLDIPAADLQALPPGNNTLGVSFANGTGGLSTANHIVTVEASPPPEDALAPQPTISTPFGDGWVNNLESHSDQYLCGTTGISGANQQVTVAINGISYAATVDGNGNWHTFLPAEIMMDGLLDGSNAIQVTAMDAYGQTGTASASFIVDTVAPELHVNTISGDGRIDRTEITAPVIISGTSEADAAGHAISMVFNERTLTSLVGADGSWQFTLQPDEMQGLSDGQHAVVVSLADTAGNITTEGGGFYILPPLDTLPTLTVNTISGDDKLNIRDAIYGMEITGTSTHLAAGTEIHLTLDGKTFTGSVWDSAGNWEIFLNDNDVASIADGKYTLNFSALDANGNGTSAARDIWMITHQSSAPHFTVNEVTQDDVSVQDGIAYVTLSGTLDGDFPVIAATVNPSDYPYYDFDIGENGEWSVTIAQSDLSTTDGSNLMNFIVADVAGNSYEELKQVEMHLDPTLTSSLMIANGESGLDLALLGLNTEHLATAEQLTASDSAERKGTPQENDTSSESLTGADGNVVSLSMVKGGVWSDVNLRAAGGQPDDLYAHGAVSHEGTLADMLAQHNLQVHTA